MIKDSTAPYLLGILIFMGYRFRITKVTYDVDPTFQHDTTPSFRVEAEEVNKDIFLNKFTWKNSNYYLILLIIKKWE